MLKDIGGAQTAEDSTEINPHISFWSAQFQILPYVLVSIACKAEV